GDEDRALFDIAADDLVGIVVEDVVGPEHVRDRDIAVGLAPFAVGDVLVDRQLPTGEPGQPGPDDLGALGQTGPGLAEDRVYGHGPGVDHRVERFARHLVQRQFVELITAGFDADEV